jgi:hypothetical protein
MRLHILHGARGTPERGHVVDMSPAEFLNVVADTEQMPSVECSSDAEKLNGDGFILAQYRDGSRSKHASQLRSDSHTQVFCYDVDNISVDELADALPVWAQYNVVIYSTYKHTNKKPRLRVLIELSRPVRSTKPNYLPAYLAVADALRIKPDLNTLDGARLFFGPQHKPQHVDDVIRHHFDGGAIDLDALNIKNAPAQDRATEQDFDAPGERPTKTELKKVAKNLRGSTRPRLQKVGAALEALLRGESFAGEGHRHNAQLNIAFELVKAFRRLDAEWFADKYLVTIWTDVWLLHGDDSRRDWVDAVTSAQRKLDDADEQTTQDDSNEPPPLTDEQLSAAEAQRGRLVVSHKGTYYIFAPRCGMYKGPFKSSEVAVAVRDHLAGVPNVTELEFTRQGPQIKSAVRLNHDYGTTVESVIWWAKKPPQPYDERSEAICLQAYKWVKWRPVYHDIADELLRAVAGAHYLQFEAYLTRFRVLEQPLPALTFVGPGGTWKSRLCEILARFWSNPYAASPGKADKIMTRFNSHLLQNPVIWSDEHLAVTAFGKPQPEAYRESITSKTQSVEQKGVDGLSLLVSAIRHVISVNSDDKIFSSEIDVDSVYATMERFLLLYTDSDAVGVVEAKWRGSEEMDRLRSGESLLEHIVWLEKNRRGLHTTEGRLFVKPHTEAQVLLRARFGDNLLQYIWAVVFRATELELNGGIERHTLKRLPLFFDEAGNCYLRPGRIYDLWTTSSVIEGSGLKKPTATTIGSVLTRAGFKSKQGERASKSKNGGWQVNLKTLEQFLKFSKDDNMQHILDKLHKIKF